MKAERQMHLVSRFGFLGAVLMTAAALTACGEVDGDLEDENVGEAAAAVGPTGTNPLPPWAVDSDPLKRPVTNSFNITTPGNADPLQLCQAGTVTSSGCTIKPEWGNWIAADPTNRIPTMVAITKCAVESTFSIQTPNGAQTFPGQWGVYPTWKTSRLAGQAKRERISSCMLSLLNGTDYGGGEVVHLDLCIIGPGGAPFSDTCTDPSMTLREGGFFGDLFADPPRAYVAGPDTNDPVESGRACVGSTPSYCCAEADTACTHRVVLAGAILGSPQQNFANKRCNSLAMSGSNQYCTSFFSTREPGRTYTNVFTSFVPAVP